jgi:hypothetical protein
MALGAPARWRPHAGAHPQPLHLHLIIMPTPAHQLPALRVLKVHTQGTLQSCMELLLFYGSTDSFKSTAGMATACGVRAKLPSKPSTDVNCNSVQLPYCVQVSASHSLLVGMVDGHLPVVILRCCPHRWVAVLEAPVLDLHKHQLHRVQCHVIHCSSVEGVCASVACMHARIAPVHALVASLQHRRRRRGTVGSLHHAPARLAFAKLMPTD